MAVVVKNSSEARYREITDARAKQFNYLMDCLLNPSKENLKLLRDASQDYGTLLGESKNVRVDESTEALRLMGKEKDLSKWKSIESECLRMGNLKLRDRLRDTGQKLGVGKLVWVFE